MSTHFPENLALFAMGVVLTFGWWQADKSQLFFLCWHDRVFQETDLARHSPPIILLFGVFREKARVGHQVFEPDPLAVEGHGLGHGLCGVHHHAVQRPSQEVGGSKHSRQSAEGLERDNTTSLRTQTESGLSVRFGYRTRLELRCDICILM